MFREGDKNDCSVLCCRQSNDPPKDDNFLIISETGDYVRSHDPEGWKVAIPLTRSWGGFPDDLRGPSVISGVLIRGWKEIQGMAA